MGLAPHWCSLRLRRQRISLVLDTSQSALGCRESMLTLARTLLDQLSAQSVENVYFLGNPTPYSPQIDLAGAIRENMNRGSFISPVLQSLGDRADALVLVLGSGTIFDLEDWEETGLIRNMILGSLGEPLNPHQTKATIAPAPTLENLFLLCQGNRMVCAALTGPGFMPLYWDRPEYRLTVSEGLASLNASDLEDYSLVCSFLSPKPESVEAWAHYQSGSRIRIVPEAAERVPLEWKYITSLRQEELDTFRAARAGKTFTCHLCRREHAPETIRCPNMATRGIFGDPLYAGLASTQNGFILLVEDTSRPEIILAHQYPGQVFPLGDDTVAVLSSAGTRSVLYRLDPGRGHWVPSGPMPMYYPYRPTGDRRNRNYYAIQF